MPRTLQKHEKGSVSRRGDGLILITHTPGAAARVFAPQKHAKALTHRERPELRRLGPNKVLRDLRLPCGAQNNQHQFGPKTFFICGMHPRGQINGFERSKLGRQDLSWHSQLKLTRPWACEFDACTGAAHGMAPGCIWVHMHTWRDPGAAREVREARTRWLPHCLAWPHLAHNDMHAGLSV